MSPDVDEAVDAFIGALVDDDPQQLYERAPCGYLSTTPDGTIVKVNQTFLLLTGYRKQDVIGRTRFDQLLTAGGRIYHETHYAPMLRMQGVAREIAFDLICAGGGRLPVLVNSVLERDLRGNARVIRTAIFDATQRREYERELLRAKQRAEASEAHAVSLARTLQQTLIPPNPPEIPRLDVAAIYRPAGDGREVGGDFYDVFQIGDDDWVVAIGDVCGKGAEAAVVTALARFTLRAATVQHREPARALRVLNEVLQRHDATRFCTVALVRLTRTDGSWRAVLCCAGHPLPLLRSADGQITEAGRPGALLGVLAEPALHDTELTLAPGEVLLLFTDGVPEGRRGSQFYGEQRTLRVLGQPAVSAAAYPAALLEDVLAFQAGYARDDIAIVAVRVPEAGTR
ncbi:MAG TPA: SpoIIE family protein phosphatase [Jatrophihabitans sp.]|nr:SpoIIE family protein phosphatase [Jatrophihabitans sp.]